MNPVAKPMLLSWGALCLAALFLSALFTIAELTNEPPASISRPFIAGSSDMHPTPISSAASIHLVGQSKSRQPLKPGVYQTRPYAIILVVPEMGLDDRCVMGGVGPGSKMPVINPNLQAVPKSGSK